MPYLQRNGMRLFYEEAGVGAPLVLIHGWTCDHTFLAPQFEHFRRSHRVISVDLRGHGHSDKAADEYTMPVFAQDVAWMCEQLEAKKPVLIGHSMGGVISLVVAGEKPELPRAVISLDSTVIPTPRVETTIATFIDVLRSGDLAARRQFIADVMFLPTDDAQRKQEILEVMCSAPKEIALSAFEHLFGLDHGSVVSRCTVPWLAVFASDVHSDLARLRELQPQLAVGQTVGSGHFLELEVPEQVNAMIERFLRVSP